MGEKDTYHAKYVEVLQMLNKVMIKFKEEQLGYEEKMDLLTEGICKGIFPISIIKESGGDYGFYYTSGYKSDFRLRSALSR